MTFSVRHASRNAGCRAEASGGPSASGDVLIYSSLHARFPQPAASSSTSVSQKACAGRPAGRARCSQFYEQVESQSGQEPPLHTFIPPRLEFTVFGRY